MAEAEADHGRGDRPAAWTLPPPPLPPPPPAAPVLSAAQAVRTADSPPSHACPQWEDPHGRKRLWECAERSTRRGAIDGVAIVAKVCTRVAVRSPTGCRDPISLACALGALYLGCRAQQAAIHCRLATRLFSRSQLAYCFTCLRPPLCPACCRSCARASRRCCRC